MQAKNRGASLMTFGVAAGLAYWFSSMGSKAYALPDLAQPLSLKQVTKQELAEAYSRLKMRTRGDSIALNHEYRMRELDIQREVELSKLEIQRLQIDPPRNDRADAAPYQTLGSVAEVPALSSYDIRISPQTVPYFQAKRISMRAIDPAVPACNMRFTVGSVEVGGAPQLASQEWSTMGGRDGGCEILGDHFAEETIVDWATFSTAALARELVIRVHNPNSVPIKIFTTIEGIAKSTLDESPF